jgi:signal peptidase I
MTRSKAEAAQAAAREEESRWDRTKANLKTIVGAVLLAIFIRIVLFEAFEIEGPSMEPTLLNGDRVVVAKFMYGLFLPFTDQAIVTWGSPSAGDVIILRSPERGQEDVDIVKRVIGVPGDTIEIRTLPVDCGNGEWSTQDVVYRNGDEIERERVGDCVDREQPPGIDNGRCTCTIWRETIGERSYLISNSYRPRRYDDPDDPERPLRVVGPVELDDDHIFVLGDHRDASNDSRNDMLGPIPLARIKGRALFIYWSNAPEEGPRWDRLFDGVN